MTISELYRKTVQELTRAGVESPEREARMIVEHLSGVPGWKVFQDFPGSTDVPDEIVDEILARRAKREPLQLILGNWDFYGREFLLSKGVFIPRQETEVLVEEVTLLCGESKSSRLRGFEVGVGSGVISLSLLCEMPFLEMTGVDVSRDAVDLAEKNARRMGVEGRLTLLCSDALGLVFEEEFDFVVSNPPYVPENEYEKLMPEVKWYEPRESLLGGSDGLGFIREMLSLCGAWVKKGGYIVFEFGFGQHAKVEEAVGRVPFLELAYVRSDLSGIPRVAVVRRI